MALINCPECNKEISDKAFSCPHCGYPISLDTNLNNNSQNNSSNYCIIFKRLRIPKYANKLIEEIKCLEKISLLEAIEIVDNPPSIISKNISLEEAKNIQNKLNEFSSITEIEELSDNPTSQEIEKILYKYKDDILHCPHCGSTSVTTGQKGFSLFSGFFGSNKTVNRCGNCGWTWEPRR